MNKNAVKELTKQGCIVDKDVAETLTDEDIKAIKQLDSAPMYITERMLDSLRSKTPEQTSEISKLQETGEHKDSEASSDREDNQENPGETETQASEREFDGSKDVKILEKDDRREFNTKVEFLDEKDISKEEKDVPEFLQYYNDRYDKMKKLLMRRKELQSATTLNRLERRQEGDEATAIGLVKDKYSTSSGKWIVELEDKTGTFKALIDEREGERIVPDEAIGVIGSMGGDIIYVNSVVRPDLPIPQGVNTTEEKVEAAYISDLHIGSEDTRHDKLDQFAKWLNSKEARNIGYLVIAGDMVEGVGVYPGQKDELQVTNIYDQYEMFEEWIEKIPENIQVLVSPGNHDIARLAEPQPRLTEKVLPNASQLNNVHLLQNPQTVRLHGVKSQGIVNLLYHGHSFDSHVDSIQDLREKAYQQPEHVMIDLLKRRHLAPTYGSNNMSPEEEDYLAITEKPDIFVSGHFHSHCNESYKGVNVINSSSFQEQTDFQKRVGHEPDPGKVTIVDFKTRNTRIKKFF